MLVLSKTDDETVDADSVFGPGTFNPYSNTVLDVANGFESLYQIARDAQAANADMKIIDEDYVHLVPLQEALSKTGYNLGFLQGDTNLVSDVKADLSMAPMVSTIYLNTTSTEIAPGVTFLQEGQYVDNTGASWKVYDVYFAVNDGTLESVVLPIEIATSAYALGQAHVPVKEKASGGNQFNPSALLGIFATVATLLVI